MPLNEERQQFFVSVTHSLIQSVRNEDGEFEVWLTEDELSELQDRLNALEKDDEYSFRRSFVPYKSADHDDAVDQFDEKTISIYQYLHDYGTDETRQMINIMNVIPKMKNTGYQDKGYGENGSPTNK